MLLKTSLLLLFDGLALCLFHDICTSCFDLIPAFIVPAHFSFSSFSVKGLGKGGNYVCNRVEG